MRDSDTPSSEESNSNNNADRGSEMSSIAPGEVSAHAKLRWLQRAREFDRTPESAWRKGHVCNLQRPCGFSEIRYDAPSETLLCARDGEIVTVLDANHEPIQDATAKEPARCAGCSRPRKRRSDCCQDCGTRAVVRQQRAEQLFDKGGQ